jgi:hypothetical protein
MAEYTFPFKTCELPTVDSENSLLVPRQPGSVVVNIASCAVLVYFMMLSKKISVRLFFASLLLFEMFHTAAHWTHIQGNVQQTVVHFIAVSVNLSLLNMLSAITGFVPTMAQVAVMGIWQLFDLTCFWLFPFWVSVGTQLTFFIGIILLYLRYFSSHRVQQGLLGVLGIVVVIYALILNEKWNCEWMLQQQPWIPPHVMIESLGLVVFLLLGETFCAA